MEGRHRIGNRVRRLRFDAGEMTQAELAAKAGVTRQTIMTIESGKYSPSLELAFRIARAFGKGIEDVFTYGEAEQAHAGAAPDGGKGASNGNH